MGTFNANVISFVTKSNEVNGNTQAAKNIHIMEFEVNDSKKTLKKLEKSFGSSDDDSFSDNLKQINEINILKDDSNLNDKKILKKLYDSKIL
jgi:hypothetical protein